MGSWVMPHLCPVWGLGCVCLSVSSCVLSTFVWAAICTLHCALPPVPACVDLIASGLSFDFCGMT